MTKKHYEAIARIIASMQLIEQYDAHTVESCAYNMAYYFKRENLKFSPMMFIEACGYIYDPEKM
jgi:hypothetical protein